MADLCFLLLAESAYPGADAVTAEARTRSGHSQG